MRLLTQLLIASYLPAVAVAQESDPPSDVPSMTPTSSDRPSQVPTFLPTMTKPSAPQPTGPQTGSCQEVGCQSFADTDSLKAFVSGLSGTATLCLCPTEYSTAKSNCVDADAEETAVVVSNGQDITLECDATTGDTCLFACPDVVFGVSEGGKLTVMGNGVTVLTGGSVFSRMEVQVGGVATVEDVTFRDTQATRPPAGGGRQLFSRANGFGGAIDSAGALNVERCTFDNCGASFQGGAIHSILTARILDSTFSSNSAAAGGAIYARGSLFVQTNVFANNSEPTIGGDADVDSCGNTGIPDDVGCSAASTLGLSIAAGFIAIAAPLLMF